MDVKKSRSLRRSYEDGCAAAHALDLVGERWALLIIRELLLGPRRFTDLRKSLGSISPNVLTQRLADLESTGVVVKRELPSPAASRVYALTSWGTQLETVLLELLKWGVRSPGFERGQALTADAMALSLKATFDSDAAHGFDCRITLLMHGNAYHVFINDGQVNVMRDTPPCHPAAIDTWAQASLSADPVNVLRLAYGKWPLQEAIQRGLCTVEGDADVILRFLSCFKVEPAIQAAARFKPST